VSYGIGSMVWIWYAQVLSQPPFPSLADVFYLAFYPLLLAGVLCLIPRSLSPVTRTRIIFDGLMIVTAALILSWYFILGPTVLQARETILAKIVGAAYPVADLALILCLILFWWRDHDHRADRSALLFISFGLTLNVYADTFFAYQGLHGGAPSPSLLDPLWTLSVVLLGIGAGITRHVRSNFADQRGVDALWPTGWTPSLAYILAPYALVPVVGGLVLTLLRSSDRGALEQGVYVGSFLLAAMVVIRQVIALRENRHLGLLARIGSYAQMNGGGSVQLPGHEASFRRAAAGSNAIVEPAFEHLQGQAMFDPVTGALNSGAMQRVLQTEVDRQRRYGRPYAVLLLEIDSIRAINAVHGHMLGDLILREFNSFVSSALRPSDAMGRWNNEEFLAVLPETDTGGAMAVSEHIRESVSAAAFGHANLRLTCSIGVAECPDDANNADDLISAAHRSMHAARIAGRNGECFADMV
jgi:diguanylate cyclase (GGDEF)-like protein